MTARLPKLAKTPELADAEAAVLRCLRERDYASAVRAVAAYEARQTTPRGIGVDWSKPNVNGEVAGLESIYNAPSRAMNDIRDAAAMMYLWGVSKPYRRWLPAEVHGDAAATALVLDAYKAQQDDNYRRARNAGWM